MNIEDLIASNPFPGLRSFKRDEADRFFGREQQIDDLVTMLNTSPLIAVSGESGCGKSSLVLAGLLHRLEENRLVHGEATEWRPVVLRPGNSPILNLAEKLVIQLGSTTSNDEYRVASLAGRLRLGGLALVEIIRLARLEPNVRILLIVDQFEEIFRFKRMTDPEEAAAFVKLILNAANDRNSPVNVILTLRTDQLGRCADFRDLPQAISRGQYLVPKLTREQRKEVIIKPIEMRRFKVAPRLVQRILNDVSDDYDDLPVMQHVMTRTWQKWTENCQGNREIDLEDYEKAGTADRALSNHADEAYDSLIGLSDVVERVFRVLTERTDEAIGIRRPLNFIQLCAVVGYNEVIVRQVIERFRQPDTAFLMPSPDIDLNSNPVIDISHESLIRQWQKLCQWVIKEAEACSELKRLVDAAHQYYQDPDNANLWRGRVLERALDWNSREHPNPAWINLYFEKEDGVVLLKSVETFITESKQASDSERSRSQRLLRVLRSLAVIIVMVSIGAVYNAITMQKKTKSRQLVNESLLELDLNPARSARLALAAIELDPDNSRAEYALRQSLSLQEIVYTEHIIPFDEPISDARITKDKSRLVVASGKSIQILDTQNYEKLGNGYVRDKKVRSAWLILNNKFLVTWTEDGQAQIQHVDDDSMTPLSCQGDKNFIYSFAISHDEHHIVAGCYEGEIAVWNVQDTGVTRLQSLTENRIISPTTITALNFSAEDQYIASGDAAGEITIWKLGVAGPWICLEQEDLDNDVSSSRVINSIAFHPTDSKLLATASDNHTAIVWQLNLNSKGCSGEKEKEKPTSWKLKHDRPVKKLQFTPRKNDNIPLMTVSDKRVFFWSNEERKEERKHNDWVTDAGVSPDDGEFVVSASSDGTARIWLTRSGTPIAILRGHRDEVTRAFFTSKDQIVTTSLDASLRIWRFHPSKLTLLAAEENRWLLSAAFDPEGQKIALCGEKNARGKHCGIVSLSNDSQMKEFDSATFDAVANASWSADNRFLVGLKHNHGLFSNVEAIFWDTQTGEVIDSTRLGKISSAKFNVQTNELFTADYDGRISVWDADSFLEDNSKPKLQFPEKFVFYNAVASPDGRWIAAIKGDEIALLDRNAPEAEARKLTDHKGSVVTAKFSHDGQWLVTASRDRTARIWYINQDQAKPDICKELTGHTAALSSAAFNPSGTQVVTSSADNTIRVWDTQHCHELTTLNWHSDSVNEVQFSPDGQSILSASDDGTAILGRCETCNQTLAELRQRVSREAKLPDDELEELQNEIKLLDFKLPFNIGIGK